MSSPPRGEPLVLKFNGAGAPCLVTLKGIRILTSSI
jgi:hypothetical protein